MKLLKAIKAIITQDADPDMGYELYNLSGVENWPRVSCETEEGFVGNAPTEPLDLENVEVISATDEEVVIWGGGDWQAPLKVTIGMEDDKPAVTSYEGGVGYAEFGPMSEDEIRAAFGIAVPCDDVGEGGICDICKRTGVEIARTDDGENTICTECDPDVD